MVPSCGSGSTDSSSSTSVYSPSTMSSSSCSRLSPAKVGSGRDSVSTPGCSTSGSGSGGSGRARSCTPSRSSSASTFSGRSRRRRRKPRARTGSSGIRASHWASVSRAVESVADAMSGSASAKCATSAGSFRRRPCSRTISARSRTEMTSASESSRKRAAASRLGSRPGCGRPSRSRSWRYCVRAPALAPAFWRRTVARRSSNCMAGWGQGSGEKQG